MLSFQEHLESLTHPSAATTGQTVDWGTLSTFPDESVFPWPPSNAAPYNKAQPPQFPVPNEIGSMRPKRGSRALTLICPETNEPIELYRSDQSISSAYSTASSEENSFQKSNASHPNKTNHQDTTAAHVASEIVTRGISQLPMDSKLHRWMEAPKAEAADHWTGEAAPMGLYFHGTSNIWNHQGDSGHVYALNVGELSVSGTLNNDMSVTKEESTSTQGVPKCSRLWTWIGDRESEEAVNDAPCM